MKYRRISLLSLGMGLSSRRPKYSIMLYSAFGPSWRIADFDTVKGWRGAMTLCEKLLGGVNHGSCETSSRDLALALSRSIALQKALAPTTTQSGSPPTREC